MSSAAAPAKRFGPGALATPANLLTVGRLVLAVPTLLLIQDRGATWLTAGLWFVLCCSDGIDGWLARHHGTTRSGAFLDPLADKFLTIGGLVALLARSALWWVPVALVAVRELLVSLYRTALGRRGISVPARRLGKWKAVAQMFAVGFYIFPPIEDVEWLQVGMLWAAVALTVISGLDILRRGTLEVRA